MKKINFLWVLPATLLVTACASSPEAPVIQRQTASMRELVEDVPRILQEVREGFNEGNCTSFIQRYTEQVYRKPANYYFPKNPAEVRELDTKADELIRNLFDMRLAMQEKFKGFQNPSVDCVNDVRKALRYTRFAEEALIIWHLERKRRVEKYTEIFGHSWPYSMYSSPNFRFQTGDLLLLRGQTFISAAIARVGDSDSQFSHLAIVGEDPKGEKYVVESLIETGTIKTKLKDYLKKLEVRAVIYRHPDSALARRAGIAVYQKANAAHLRGETIPYDFTMNPNDHSQLFCAELVQMAYELASRNEIRLPRYKTSFYRLKGKQLLKELSMDVASTFAPADIELDPRFRLVAEWRYIPTLRKTKAQDAIYTSVFDWMEKRNYELKPEPISWLGGNLASMIRKIGLFPDKMQKHMSPSLLKTVIRLSYLSEALENHLLPVEAEYYQKNGHSMSFSDMLRDLEKFRSEDCSRYEQSIQNRGPSDEQSVRSDFHWIFRGGENCR